MVGSTVGNLDGMLEGISVGLEETDGALLTDGDTEGELEEVGGREGGLDGKSLGMEEEDGNWEGHAVVG